MELTPELAEVTGALIGDGCLSEYFVVHENRVRHEIAFTGNIDEFDYYESFIQPIFQKMFFVKGRLFRRGNSTRYHLQNPNAFNFFSSLGLPIGKKSHSVFIPGPYFSNKELLCSVLRGIWDTDGSVYRRYSKAYSGHPKHYSNLLVLQFKSVSQKLAAGVKKGLNAFSISSNKISCVDGAYVVRITRQGEIHKFLKTIGFRNPHHLKRLAFLAPDIHLKVFPNPTIFSAGP